MLHGLTLKEERERLSDAAREELEAEQVAQAYSTLLASIQQPDTDYNKIKTVLRTPAIVSAFSSEYMTSFPYLLKYTNTQDNPAKKILAAIISSTRLNLTEKLKLLSHLLTIQADTNSLAPHWGIYWDAHLSYTQTLFDACESDSDFNAVINFLEKFFLERTSLMHLCNCVRMHHNRIAKSSIEQEQKQRLWNLIFSDIKTFLQEAADIFVTQTDVPNEYLIYIYEQAQWQGINLTQGNAIFQRLLSEPANYPDLWNLKKATATEAFKLAFCRRWLNSVETPLKVKKGDLKNVVSDYSEQLRSICEEIKDYVTKENLENVILKIANLRILRMDLTHNLAYSSKKLCLVNSKPAFVKPEANNPAAWILNMFSPSLMNLECLSGRSDKKKAQKIIEEEGINVNSQMMLQGAKLT